MVSYISKFTKKSSSQAILSSEQSNNNVTELFFWFLKMCNAMRIKPSKVLEGAAFVGRYIWSEILKSSTLSLQTTKISGVFLKEFFKLFLISSQFYPLSDFFIITSSLLRAEVWKTIVLFQLSSTFF